MPNVRSPITPPTRVYRDRFSVTFVFWRCLLKDCSCSSVLGRLSVWIAFLPSLRCSHGANIHTRLWMIYVSLFFSLLPLTDVSFLQLQNTLTPIRIRLYRSCTSYKSVPFATHALLVLWAGKVVSCYAESLRKSISADFGFKGGFVIFSVPHPPAERNITA